MQIYKGFRNKGWKGVYKGFRNKGWKGFKKKKGCKHFWRDEPTMICLEQEKNGKSEKIKKNNITKIKYVAQTTK